MTDKDSLSDAERLRMRNWLRAYMYDNPARAPFVVQAMDFSGHAAQTLESFLTAGFARFGVAAAVLVLIAGGSTSYAAESALPGDALYSIKTGINEKVALVLARTPTAHAELDAELAQRRIMEAETLAVAGKLSPKVSAQLGSKLELTTADFNSQIATLALASSSDATSASDMQSDFEASLAAQAQVLAVISAAVPQAAPGVEPLQNTIHGHLSAVRQARNRADTLLAASTTATLATSAHATEASALRASKRLQALVPEVKNTFGATSSSVIATRASTVQEALNAGAAHLQRGSYGEALGSFQAAIRTAQDTQAAVTAGMQLRKILGPRSSQDGEKGNFDANGLALTLMSATNTDASSSAVPSGSTTSTGGSE